MDSHIPAVPPQFPDKTGHLNSCFGLTRAGLLVPFDQARSAAGSGATFPEWLPNPFSASGVSLLSATSRVLFPIKAF
ncbi:hypothetical protein GCM10008938_09190 [Deinococcus roseus]|uniref:Uncharacterized protein n=1 Tax=Deinococcus roseus TaxID=392414 RepID=A0ABQ2CVN5_9DEIO|nr:hypothetical protein GCM10008938_09190 [Deinococcus roseus]